jgi:polyhydroxyalkanoate synthesis regulator phasin
MGILDKLKPTPRWKHADAAIRLEAVREVDDASVLALLAETDPDAKVRRAAMAGVNDPGVLARIAGADADPETRDRATDRLLDFALDPNATEAVALTAVRGISDGRRLSAAAKTASLLSVRLDALARIMDEGSLGAVARHAKDENIARAALDRLADTEKILDAALNSDHRDVALAAFDRLIVPASPDLSLLATIESRTQQKPVAKRARAILQAIEDAEIARRAAEEERRAKHASLCEAAEHLAGVEWQHAEVELGRLLTTWAEQVDVAPETAARFARAVDRAKELVALGHRAAEEAAERARVQAEALATRVALCARVETLDGDDIPEQLSAIEEEWRSLAPLVGSGPEADRLDQVFAQAAAACRNRHEQGAKLAETRAALTALVEQAEGLPASEDAPAIAARWQALAREARGLAAALSSAGRPAADLDARLNAVDAVFAAREARLREAAAKAQQDQLAKFQRMIERAARAAESETITLREGERLMRDIRLTLDEAPRDHGKDLSDALATLRALQEKIAPRVRELREMDDWRRFANAQQQEQLILQAETLVASLAVDDQAGRESNLAAAAKTLRDLHLKWKDVSEAPRDQAQRLWERFRTATDLIRLRCEGYFKKVKEERGVNLERKTAIVLEAEQLTSAAGDWAKTAERLQQLQAEWMTLGPIGREQGRDLSQRFRTATNQFFTRRREEVTARKKMWSDNMARKEALCARAEELAVSTDWDVAVPELKRLQAEWKTIGPIRRAKSEEVWARFRAAADKLFDRYKNRHQIALESKLAEREAMVVELESLAAPEAEAPAVGVAEKVQELRANWTRSVPIPSSEMNALTARWQAAFARVIERWADAFRGSEFDPAAILQKMEKLIGRVEALVATTGADAPAEKTLSQTELLAAKLRSALASNAMGKGVSDESKWRQAGDVVRDAQSAWLRLAPVTGDQARALESRFQKACRRIMDQVRSHTSHSSPAGGGGKRPETKRPDQKRQPTAV